jgi:hypothetical protein
VITVSYQLQVPIFDPEQHEVEPAAVELLSAQFARQHQVLPVTFNDDKYLRIATAALLPDSALTDQLSSITGRQVQLALTISDDLDKLIERHYALGNRKRSGDG